MKKPIEVIDEKFLKFFLRLPFLSILAVIFVIYYVSLEIIFLIAMVHFAIVINWIYVVEYANSVKVFNEVLIIKNVLAPRTYFFDLRNVKKLEFNSPIKDRRKYNIVIHVDGEQYVYYLVSVKDHHIEKAENIMLPFGIEIISHSS